MQMTEKTNNGDSKVRVLCIGQLPVELGGNYTTGAANVLYELSKQHVDDVETYTYATNAAAKKVVEFCNYEHQYIGYKYNLWNVLADLVFHPIRSWKEAKIYKHECNYNPLRGFFYKHNFRKVIKLCQPDVIHCHDFDKMYPLRQAMGKHQLPIVLTCHGVFWNDDEKVHEAIKYNIKLADHVTGLTKETYAAIRELEVEDKDITIIPNGVDSKKFYYSEEARKAIRKQFGVDDDTKVFITVASVQPRKGQMAFVKILENLNINYQYWIVGKGSDYALIEEYSKGHKIEDKVKLLGYVTATELYKYYSGADVYAHASTAEGQALSEVEAYTTGMRTILNKKIVDTVVTELDENYFILDFDNINTNDLLNWINTKQLERVSRNNLDWSIVQNSYGNLYKKIAKK